MILFEVLGVLIKLLGRLALLIHGFLTEQRVVLQRDQAS
tara:strand:- start:819 stop:935 length:117 start_codon:yes stop_codon:yes gene_type:complete